MFAATGTISSTGSRPATLVAAVLITVAGAVLGIATLGMIPDEAPGFIGPVQAGVAVLWIACSWFMWQGHRWAAIAIFVTTAISGLLALPGPFAAPDVSDKILAGIGIVQAVAVCWLLLLRSVRRSLA